MEYLLKYEPLTLALFSTLFTWAITTLSASMVFFSEVLINA